MSKIQINAAHLPTLAEGILKSNALYRIVSLESHHAPLCAEFHQGVRDRLPESKKSFMLPKDTDYFLAHMDNAAGGAVVGIISEGYLIGQSIIHHPLNPDSYTGMVDFAMPEGIQANNASITQAISIDEKFRGQDLMDRMLDVWIDRAAQAGRSHVLAEIDVRNPASWHNFLMNGLSIVSIGHDPEDGVAVYNACEETAIVCQRRATPGFNREAMGAEIGVSPSDLTEQERLFARGYVLKAWEAATKTLVFIKPAPQNAFVPG